MDELVRETFAQLVEANQRYAAEFSEGGLAAPPARQLVVVTCMDARIDPLRSLGLSLGDAHVVRNAGGRVSDDVLRSVAVSSHVLGTRAVVVIHHTRCGMVGVTDDDLRSAVRKGGGDPGDTAFLAISGDPDEALRDDVERLRRSRLLSDAVRTAGYRYDVDSGRVEEVVPLT